uniref:Uncharacterized protein n=1 Tax=Anopheles arabiensis TaxID=7173 RepID=A0A182IEY6_ANOAR
MLVLSGGFSMAFMRNMCYIWCCVLYCCGVGSFSASSCGFTSWCECVRSGNPLPCKVVQHPPQQRPQILFKAINLRALTAGNVLKPCLSTSHTASPNDGCPSAILKHYCVSLIKATHGSHITGLPPSTKRVLP